MSMRADTVFEVLFPLMFEQHPKPINIDAIIMFTVTGKNGGVWTMDLRKGGSGKVFPGSTKESDLNIILRDDFLELFLSGQYSGKEALQKGQLGVVGDMHVFESFVECMAQIGAASQTTKTNNQHSKP